MLYRFALSVGLVFASYAQAQTVTNIGDGSLLVCIEEDGFTPYLGVILDRDLGDYYEADIDEGLNLVARRLRKAKKKLNRIKRSPMRNKRKKKKKLQKARQNLSFFKELRQEILNCEAGAEDTGAGIDTGLPATPGSTGGTGAGAGGSGSDSGSTDSGSGNTSNGNTTTSNACSLITSTRSATLERPFSRIINGNLCSGASPVVEVLLADAAGQVFGRCSGTVVSDTGVITAAHCFDGGQVAQVGINTGVQTIMASAFGAHPSWESNPSDFVVERNDVAYVTASQSLGVSTVSLLPTTSSLVVGEQVLIAGYGLNESMTADGLRAGFMTLNSFDNDSVVALFDGSTGSNSCSGDSGGPLFVQRSGVWYLAGVTSNGDNQNCGAFGGQDTSRWSNVNSTSNRSFFAKHLGVQ